MLEEQRCRMKGSFEIEMMWHVLLLFLTYLFFGGCILTSWRLTNPAEFAFNRATSFLQIANNIPNNRSFIYLSCSPNVVLPFPMWASSESVLFKSHRRAYTTHSICLTLKLEVPKPETMSNIYAFLRRYSFYVYCYSNLNRIR